MALEKEKLKENPDHVADEDELKLAETESIVEEPDFDSVFNR